jgi:DNA-directed RNA polymerase specialized sigma24 family protein
MTMTYAQPMPRYTRARLAVPALWRQVIRATGKGDEAVVVTEPDRSAHTQLEIYDGVLAAFDRRSEVQDVLSTSPDRATAVRRLRELLGASHLQATALLDLPLTAASHDRIARRAAELRAALDR